ncbi:glycosyltransferase family 4 protein [Caenimonas terrae]|uniref:Glycosyltransferase family 4 protein n=1 Tax=Caenimonas terrae TaxID=696074 RepID=A0ABW0NHJ3_9BURK
MITGLSVGGAELMLKRLVESHLANASYEHAVVSLTNVGIVGQQLQDLGVEVQALRMRSLLDVPLVVGRLARLIRRANPDVVQTWMYHADLMGGVAARLAGKNNVVWGIRTTRIDARAARTTRLVMKLCARLSYSVPQIIVCAADASRLAHIAAGYDASRMVVVANGLDFGALAATAEQRDALRQRCGFGADVTVIGSVGRFHPDKGQEYFVQAAGLVAQQHKEARFLMIGRDVDTRNALLATWISATGCPERFVLLGERPDVSVCLAAMDLFCLSSRTEGFPNVVGEAMAMGLPCVVTNVGDAALLVADSGEVVPAEDVAALAGGLRRLLMMTPNTRQLKAQKAMSRIRSQFSMDRARERFESIYERIAKTGRR